MRKIVAILLLSITIAQPFAAWSSQSSGTAAAPARNSQPKAQSTPPNCSNNGTYVNSRGEVVPRPENCSSAPQGATAQCRDGFYSFSRSRRGTCSHHGGVAKWL